VREDRQGMNAAGDKHSFLEAWGEAGAIHPDQSIPLPLCVNDFLMFFKLGI